MNWLSLDRKQLVNVENSLKEIIARAADEDSHTQFTPLALCQELVQKIIDQEISPEKEWLVIANLEILYVVRAWFVYNGWSLDKLHYASATDRKLKFAKLLLGNENVSKYEYEKLKEWDPGMKFDVVLSNPPYQDSSEKSHSNSLWVKFIEKSISLLSEDGFCEIVCPNSWINGYPNRDISKKRLTAAGVKSFLLSNGSILTIVLGTDLNAFFDVGIDFSYFVFQKTKRDVLTKIHHDRVTFELNIREIPWIPKQVNNLVISILSKTVWGDRENFEIRGSTRNNSDVRNSVIKFNFSPELFELYNTSAKWKSCEKVYSTEKCHWQDSKKVIYSDSGYASPIYDDGTLGLCHHGHAILVENKQEGLNLISYLNSKLIKFISKTKTSSGLSVDFSNIELFIPKIPLMSSWSDAELFAYFNLTQEEIDLIESTVK